MNYEVDGFGEIQVDFSAAFLLLRAIFRCRQRSSKCVVVDLFSKKPCCESFSSPELYMAVNSISIIPIPP